MPSIGQLISRHNKSSLISEPTQANPDVKCGCRGICPVEGKCKSECVVYQASVKRQDSGEISKYIGLCSTKFNIRYNSHTNSFRHEKNRSETKLSDHIWDLKLNDVGYELTWKIISNASQYSPSTKTCNLCNREIYYILFKPTLATLNKRNKIFSVCRHRAKFKLINQK